MLHRIITGLGLFFYIIGLFSYIFSKEKKEGSLIARIVAVLFISAMTYSMFYAFLN